jgi:FtsP/CotA-like multicopper oxidase with cupredoxin domain
MDGVPGVTQCVITAGSTFMYNLTIPHDQSGTFWYHGHVGTSRADGLYGGFVVHAPSPKPTVRGLRTHESAESVRYGYEREFLLLIGDWYHLPGDKVLAWYMSIESFGNEVCSQYPIDVTIIYLIQCSQCRTHCSSMGWATSIVPWLYLLGR